MNRKDLLSCIAGIGFLGLASFLYEYTWAYLFPVFIAGGLLASSIIKLRQLLYKVLGGKG